MSPQDVDIVLIAWCLFPRSGDCRNHLVWFWISMVLDMIADISLSRLHKLVLLPCQLIHQQCKLCPTLRA